MDGDGSHTATPHIIYAHIPLSYFVFAFSFHN